MGALIFLSALAASLPVNAQERYDGLRISAVDIVVANYELSAFTDQALILATDTLGPVYSAPRIRDAIQAIYNTQVVDSIVVTADRDGDAAVKLTFTIKRKAQAERVSIVMGPMVGDTIREQDLLFKLNLVTAGSVVTDQTLQENANQILEYLRERGYYRSEVTYEKTPARTATDVSVVFRVTPNEQARVERFDLRIEGWDKPVADRGLKLTPGERFTREKLTRDVLRVRELLRKDSFLAPTLDEPRVTYDDDTNTVAISIAGKAGPEVTIEIDADSQKVNSRTQTRLLPIRREGTLDYAAIVEGERRLEGYFQEQGYFFANVTPICIAEPQLRDVEGVLIGNDTEFLCSMLGGEELMGSKITVRYAVDLNRRLKLTDIRVRGTEKLTAEDVITVLDSQEANILGIIPVFGYGRGYTSTAILEKDAATIRSLMAELGYRDATVRVNQGVTPDGEDLIITFVVDEGQPSVVDKVTVTGNVAIPSDVLLAEIPELSGRNFSRARIRNATRKLSELYSKEGFYYARVVPVIDEESDPAPDQPRRMGVEFRIENEGRRIQIDRVLITGNERTRTSAIERALAVEKGELLTAADVYRSEQELYSTDAFSRVEIKPQPGGDGPDGRRLADIIVNVTEQPPRLISYGGGFSTDLGLSGFFDIRHVNLFGKLWQGGARARFSQRQQLVGFDLINPRFLKDGDKRFAPLTLSAQYQRDSTVTRFFRSTFDRGTFGIVQRLDEEGNPIDEFGNPAGSPTINRLAFTAETNRTISRKDRSILFLRYRFEDVRLYNIESLLIKDLLRPDQQTTISGFGATFVRDTRRNCNVRFSLLELIAKGEQGDDCRYNASDPTHGNFLTADYNVSLPMLGANVGFQKFQATFNQFYTFGKLKKTTIAARGILGLSNVFSGGERFNNTEFPSLNGLLPISERFFAGGANTLRGFAFEEAGPRVVVVPQGTFINSSGDPVFLDPFTIPFGGNALAITNIEARTPLTASLRAVLFYDGGNVFRRTRDIFKAPSADPNNIAEWNQRAVWTHTVGLGLRIKTPIGGEFGVDYGYNLRPPEFLIPQANGPNAIYRLRQTHLHFRFSQAF
jgi:outer membrane protein insertion porin family